jgi:signal transduction histidine kinase
MNAILACSQLLTDMPSLTEEQRELSQMIQGSGQQLLSLINDILDFSKVSCAFFAENIDKPAGECDRQAFPFQGRSGWFEEAESEGV